MSSKVIIGRFGPSARQLVDAAHAIAIKPGAELVIQNRPNAEGMVFGGVPYTGRRQKDYDRALQYLHEMADRTRITNQVFLGGACAPTTWREDTAIPILEAAGIKFYDPFVEDWNPGLMAIEAEAKTTSHVILFVFDHRTRATATLTEAIEFMLTSNQKVVLVSAYVEPGQEIAGQALSVKEAMDINIARGELFGIAKATQVPVFDTVADAVQECVTLCEIAASDTFIREVG